MTKENKENEAITASPQIENGHIDIANELVEALARTQLSGYESRVLWALWRKTWGWVKKDKKGKTIYDITKNGKRQLVKLKKASISSKEWVRITGLHKSHISRTLRGLYLRNIVIKLDNEKKWGFQKNYNKWLAPIKRDLLPKMVTDSVTQIDNSLLPKMVTPVTQMGNKITGKPKNNKPLLTPKETLIKKHYIKKEKDHINSLEKEDKKELVKEERTEREEVLDYWNNYNINPASSMTPFIRDIDQALKIYPINKIQQAISNYIFILKGEGYFFDHKFTLDTFLKAKNIEKFLNLDNAKDNYKTKIVNENREGEEIPLYRDREENKDSLDRKNYCEYYRGVCLKDRNLCKNCDYKKDKNKGRK